VSDRPRYTIILEPEKHVADPTRALRAALKRLLRSYGLKAISVQEAPAKATAQDYAVDDGGAR
jgi:hypothetical protein